MTETKTNERFLLSDTDYTGWRNWGIAQPARLVNVQDYIEDAREKGPKFESMVRTFAKRFDFPLDFIVAEPKTVESATRKLWDRTSRHQGRPEMIKDYGRGRITIPVSSAGVDQLDTVITDLVHSSNTVAYKDQFFRPNEETGYRSFKATWDVQGHLFELQVEYEAMKLANDLTLRLRETERSLKNIEPDIQRRCTSRGDLDAHRHAAKITTQFEDAIQIFRGVRKAVHDLYAEECGLNTLRDPSVDVTPETILAAQFAQSIKKSRNPLAKPAVAVLQQAQLWLTDHRLS